MGEFIVSYNDGNFSIGNKTFNKITKEFYSLDINKKSSNINLNKNDNEFKKEQQILRALDMMKDGKNTKINEVIKNVVYPDLTIDALKLTNIEDKFIEHFNTKIKKRTWTRVSKDSKLDALLDINYIFYDVGLNPKYYIKSGNITAILNFANEIVDPGKREFKNISDKQELFPSGTLIIDESFLDLFGFINCSITATKPLNKPYDYAITLPGIRITDKTWFEGNKSKNEEILNGNDDAKKNGLLVCKELGDTLQVLIMLMWKLQNTDNKKFNKTYSMITNDKVVLLMCMVLNLNCILHSRVPNDKNGNRIRSIDIFESDQDTQKKAIERFNKVKREIFAHNKEFIKIINELSRKADTLIYLQGVPFIFPVSFYISVINDLNAINTQLNEYKPGINDDINVINQKIIEMKLNFTFDMFIHKVKGSTQLKISQKRFYTNKKDLWEINIILALNGGVAFYQYGEEKKNKNTIYKGRGGNDDKLFDYLELYEEEMNVIDEKNPTKQINLLDDLKDNIFENLIKLNIIKKIDDTKKKYEDYDIFNDYYSELLFIFYLNDMVVYDEEQTELIQKIQKYLFIDFNNIYNKIDIIYPLFTFFIDNNTLNNTIGIKRNSTYSEPGPETKSDYSDNKNAKTKKQTIHRGPRRMNNFVLNKNVKGGNKTRKLNKNKRIKHNKTKHT